MCPVCQDVTFLDPQNRFFDFAAVISGSPVREVELCEDSKEKLLVLINGYCENKAGCTAKGEIAEKAGVSINTLEYCQGVVSTDHSHCARMITKHGDCLAYEESDDVPKLEDLEWCAASKEGLDAIIKGYCVQRPACTPKNDVYVRAQPHF